MKLFLISSSRAHTFPLFLMTATLFSFTPSIAIPAESYPRYSNRFNPQINKSRISIRLFGVRKFKYANIPVKQKFIKFSLCLKFYFKEVHTYTGCVQNLVIGMEWWRFMTFSYENRHIERSVFPCVHVCVAKQFLAKFKFWFLWTQNYMIIIKNGNSRRIRVAPEDNVLTPLSIRSHSSRSSSG